jgi:hypothetical protein
MPSIDIDKEVWERIKADAEPLVDDANSVLRRLLGLDGPAQPPSGALGPRRPPPRAPFGSLLPEAEYEAPILEELAKRAGGAPAREIIEAVGERLGERLTARDKDLLNSGGIRWENRVQFARLNLRKRGLLRQDSQRGIWELSEAGWEAAEAEKPGGERDGSA